MEKLTSLMSQINIYLGEMELKNIEERAREIVEIMVEEATPERKEEIFKGQWSRREKWIMLWATSYSTKKIKKVNKERTKVWSDIFYPRCPYKQEFNPKQRSTVKSNVLKENTFSDMELKKMEEEIDHNITSNTPLEDILIEPPPNNERTEHDARTFEDLFGADEEASFI